MDIEKILKEERIVKGRKALRIAFTTYLTNREEAFKNIDINALKDELRRIKERSILNLENLKFQAVKKLRQQGIKVYEARDAKEACKIALKLIPKGQKIVKSKSNVISEIGLLEKLEKRNKVIETDCGDFIVKLCDEKPSHPVTPALHIPLDKIVRKIKQKFGKKIEKKPDKIIEWIRKHLRNEILDAKIGLTGANAISADGAIFILENEGNISLVSRIPEKHIIITSIDKIVASIQDAITICQASAIWGTGTSLPTYINVISSPSKTADIQKKLVYGVHGAKEVHLILIDNGRSKIIEQGFEELLYCINCGCCLYFCPVYRQVLDNYGLHYFGGRGIGMALFQQGIREAFDAGLYFCTTCRACKNQCPLEIDIPELIRRLRKRTILLGITTYANERMIENIKAVGNPFGEEVKEGKIPKELYCC
jgi:iron-sulfur cluster protein